MAVSLPLPSRKIVVIIYTILFQAEQRYYLYNYHVFTTHFSEVMTA